MNCRVFEQPNGHIIVTIFATNSKKKNETDLKLMNRQTLKLTHKGLPYVDIDPGLLPINSRNKWRMSTDKQSVIIDNALETVQDLLEAEIKILDIEMAKTSPDPVAVIKYQHNLENLKKETWKARKKGSKQIVS